MMTFDMIEAMQMIEHHFGKTAKVNLRWDRDELIVELSIYDRTVICKSHFTLTKEQMLNEEYKLFALMKLDGAIHRLREERRKFMHKYDYMRDNFIKPTNKFTWSV